MLQTQNYLRSPNQNLQTLEAELGIETTFSTTEPLVILNYNQIKSPKTHPIVSECRSLVLELNSWNLVGKSFNRFFNLGEAPELVSSFNWNKFEATTKEDGSLILLYNYNNSWKVNTRGSFGLGELPYCPKKLSWNYYFWSLCQSSKVQQLPPELCITFELCTLYNKVVRAYSVPQLFLLTVINRNTLEEYSAEKAAQVAEILGVPRPSSWAFSSAQEILNYLAEIENTNPTFEGFVLRSENLRIKVKNKGYLRLHAMRGNGENIFSPKCLVPFILSNELGELLSVYPETLEYVSKFSAVMNEEYVYIESVWREICNLGLLSQKEFAIMVQNKCPKWSSLFFTARKTNVHIREVWLKSEKAIIERLFS